MAPREEKKEGTEPEAKAGDREVALDVIDSEPGKDFVRISDGIRKK